MHNEINLNYKTDNSQALNLLEQESILHQVKIDLRYIIRSDTNDIEYCGPNVTGAADFIRTEPRLSHFGQVGECVSRSVSCNGGPAKIFAMTHRRGSRAEELHLRASLPINSLATDLLKEPCPTLEIFFPDRTMYGDAALITGTGVFWALSQSGLLEDELRDFAAMLATPWEIRPCDWQPALIFLQEPNLTDLTSMRLRWG